jgi:hypothetical protein
MISLPVVTCLPLCPSLPCSLPLHLLSPTQVFLLPKHLNFYRLYPSVPGSYVPPVAIGSFATELEEPEMAEGFAEEVKRIGWVGWWDGVGGDATVGGGGNGMDEKKKRRWEGWMI